MTKLSQTQVVEMRQKWATGLFTQAQLAATYGVVQGHVSRILNGKSNATGVVYTDVLQRIANAAR